jgi:hypothetical protein
MMLAAIIRVWDIDKQIFFKHTPYVDNSHWLVNSY